MHRCCCSSSRRWSNRRKSFERENPSCFLFQGWPRAGTYQKQQHQQQPGHAVSEDDDDNGFDKGPERHPFLNSGANNYRLICIMLAKLYPGTSHGWRRLRGTGTGSAVRHHRQQTGKRPLPGCRKEPRMRSQKWFYHEFSMQFSESHANASQRLNCGRGLLENPSALYANFHPSCRGSRKYTRDLYETLSSAFLLHAEIVWI